VLVVKPVTAENEKRFIQGFTSRCFSSPDDGLRMVSGKIAADYYVIG